MATTGARRAQMVHVNSERFTPGKPSPLNRTRSVTDAASLGAPDAQPDSSPDVSARSSKRKSVLDKLLDLGKPLTPEERAVKEAKKLAKEEEKLAAKHEKLMRQASAMRLSPRAVDGGTTTPVVAAVPRLKLSPSPPRDSDQTPQAAAPPALPAPLAPHAPHAPLAPPAPQAPPAQQEVVQPLLSAPPPPLDAMRVEWLTADCKDINPDAVARVCIIGSSGVGKTSLAVRLRDGAPPDRGLKSTIGVEFIVKTIRCRDKYVKFQLMDTAGQERFGTPLPKQFYRDAVGVIVVYSVTDRESFLSTAKWLQLVQENSVNPLVMLLGNKKDLDAQRSVSSLEVLALAQEKQFWFYETSATDLISGRVEEAFGEFFSKIIELRLANKLWPGLLDTYVPDNNGNPAQRSRGFNLGKTQSLTTIGSGNSSTSSAKAQQSCAC